MINIINNEFKIKLKFPNNYILNNNNNFYDNNNSIINSINSIHNINNKNSIDNHNNVDNDNNLLKILYLRQKYVKYNLYYFYIK